MKFYPPIHFLYIMLLRQVPPERSFVIILTRKTFVSQASISTPRRHGRGKLVRLLVSLEVRFPV